MRSLYPCRQILRISTQPGLDARYRCGLFRWDTWTDVAALQAFFVALGFTVGVFHRSARVGGLASFGVLKDLAALERVFTLVSFLALLRRRCHGIDLPHTVITKLRRSTAPSVRSGQRIAGVRLSHRPTTAAFPVGRGTQAPQKAVGGNPSDRRHEGVEEQVYVRASGQWLAQIDSSGEVPAAGA